MLKKLMVFLTNKNISQNKNFQRTDFPSKNYLKLYFLLTILLIKNVFILELLIKSVKNYFIRHQSQLLKFSHLYENQI